MAFASLDFGSLIKINKYWTDFKSVITTKSLLIQYEQDTNQYIIFAIDGEIVYTCIIYKGTVSDPNNYSQVTNDADKTDFTTNYQSQAGLKSTDSDRVASGNITTNQSVAINSNNSGVVTIGATGTWTGTLVFEVTLDNTNWVSMVAMNISTNAYVSSITANGNFELASAGYQQVRVRGNTVATGTATIALDAAKELQGVSVIASLPTGANTIGAVTGSGNFTVVQPTAANLNATVVGTVTSNIGTTNGLALDATVSTMSGKLPTSVGQKAMAASLPVVIASDQSAVSVTGSVGAIIVGYDGITNRNILTDSTGKLMTNISVASIMNNGVITNTQNISSNCAYANILNFVITNTNNLTPWTGTLVFESSIDGATWVNLNVVNLSTGLMVTSTTSNGNFEIANNGWVQVRVRGNTVTANSATILINQSVDSQFVTSSDRSNSGSITTTQNLSVNSQGCGITTIGVSGTWTGTLVFEVTLDNLIWITYNALSLSSGQFVSSTTSNGNFELSSGGYQQVRVRGNTVATGTANIALNASSSLTSISIDSPVFGNGTAGSADSRVVTVQGITGGTSLPVSLNNTDKTNSGTITTSNGNVAISSQGSSTVVIGITGTWVGTIVFEATVDNTNWIAITSTNALTTITTSSTTANGTFQISCGGYLQIRARGNTISSGTATIAMDSSTGIQNISLAGSIQVGDFLASGTLSALGNTVIISTSGCSSAVVSVTGTWTGVIINEGQTGDNNWVQLYGWSIDGNSYNNTMSSNQHMVVACGGFSQVRCRMYSYTSGTANISWNASLGQNINIASIINSVPIFAKGYGPAGSTPYGDPNLMSGVDGGGITRIILTDTAGHLNIGSGTAGTPTSNVVTVQGISGGTSLPVIISNTDRTSTGTITNTQNIAVNTQGTSTVAISLTGTWTGTVVFEKTVDGTSWVTAYVSSPQTGLSVTSATTNGIYEFGSAGYQQFRVRGNTVATGTLTVYLNAGNGVGDIAITSPLPTGSNTIGAVIGSGSFTVAQATAANLNATVTGTVISNIGTTNGLALDTTVSTMSGKLPASVGQKAMAASLPVVLASDQSSIPVTISATDRTNTGSITNTQNIAINTQGTSTVSISLTGTWTGTAVFEKTVDGTNWVAAYVASPNTGLIITSTTVNGIYEFGSAGYQQFRVRGNTVATGTLTVAINAGDGIGDIAITSPLPVGTNTIGNVNINGIDRTTTGTITTSNGNISINAQGTSNIGIAITGTWTGTLVFEKSIDGTNWVAAYITLPQTGTISTSTTANGTFEWGSAGYQQFRVRGNTVATGTATIYLNAGVGSGNIALNSPLPPGTNTIGAIVGTATIGNTAPTSALEIGAVNPSGTLDHLITGDSSELIIGARQITGIVNNIKTSYPSSSFGSLNVDPWGNLATRSLVSNDEGPFYDDFNTPLNITLTGTLTFTNGSMLVTGSGTLFTSQINIYNLIKKSTDPDTTAVQVDYVVDDTHLYLQTAYQGSTGSGTATVASWHQPTGTGGSLSISNSNIIIASGTTANSVTGVYNQVDYMPLSAIWQTTISQAITNQTIFLGFQDTFTSPTIVAGFQFSGTDNTKVTCVTQASVGITDTTLVTLPNSLVTSSQNLYQIYIEADKITFLINNIQVAMNQFSLIPPFTSLTSCMYITNGATAASSTTVSIDVVIVRNYDSQIVIARNYIPALMQVQASGQQLSGYAINNNSPVLAGGSDGTNVRTLATDKSGRLITTTAAPSTAINGIANGFLVQAATTTSQVMSTVYTEQTTNGQRSFKSASANDTAAGTGAQTVTITYYDQTMAGPFTETVTLAGTGTAATVSTTICFIESMVVATAGSGGVAAGIISLYSNNAGGGTVIGTIAAGQIQTNWCHHYVGSTVTCNISSSNYANTANTAQYQLRAKALAGTFYKNISDIIYQSSTNSSTIRTYTNTIRVVGPARIVAYVTPNAAGSATYYAGFDYYDA